MGNFLISTWHDSTIVEWPYCILMFRVIIRPITLSVRMAANLVAGHLLITLIRSPEVSISYGYIPASTKVNLYLSMKS